MQDVIFRMYDIRGKVGSEFIIDQAYDATRAIAYYFVQKKPNTKTVAVAMDGRTHSPAIKELVCKALQDSGMNVIFIGICPSPVLYFALHTLSVDAGIMVTASHNPKEYNGLKLCLGKESLWGVDIGIIRDYFKAGKKLTAELRGSYDEYAIIPPYVDYLVKKFPHLIGMQLPIVMDCGNGVTGAVIPQLIKSMHWNNVDVLYPEVDGNYPNHEADPVVEENMLDVKHALATTNAIVGIGFDGDGDRMAAMTKDGHLVPGDQLLALFSQEYIKNNPGASIVCDIKSSAGLLEVVKQWGGTAWLSPSGHSIIKQQMQEHAAGIGGELSGHFCFKDRYLGFDDAVYAALRLIEILVVSGKSLAELLEFFPHKMSSPEFRVACDEDKKLAIVEAVRHFFEQQPNVDLVTIDGVRVTSSQGLVIVRASNTQPVLSLRFESNSPEKLHKLKEQFVAIMQPYFETNFLRHQIQFEG